MAKPHDLCIQALKDSGALGIGQAPSAEELNDTWVRLQWLFSQWTQERFVIYHLVTYTVASTGQTEPYTIGPGGNIDTNYTTGIPTAAGNEPWAGSGMGLAGVAQPGNFTSFRPNRIESAFFMQINTIPNGPVVYGLKLLGSMEDYRRLCLPNLTTFSLVAFYDPAIPLGKLYVWPWPNQTNYVIGVTAREQLPVAFVSQASVISLPPEYFQAIVSNLALAIRPKYGLGTYPGDMVPIMARNGLNLLRKGHTAIAELQTPKELVRGGLYSIYSDQNY